MENVTWGMPFHGIWNGIQKGVFQRSKTPHGHTTGPEGACSKHSKIQIRDSKWECLELDFAK